MRLVLLIFVWLLLLLCASAYAQTRPTPTTRADASGLRTLRTFDFEERALGNVEDTPLGWVKVEGSGMPHYLKGIFDFSVAHSGQTSFRMDLNGGSIAFRYPANRIFVVDGALYRVETMVRTTALQHSRARLSAYFCDEDGKPITSSIRTSDFDQTTAEDGQFHPLSLDMVADAKAVSLVIEIGLMQLRLASDPTLGERQLAVEDIRGSAWFDDVKVTQIPDVEIFTDRPTNVFYRDEPINVRLRLHDQLTSDLTAELRVFDIDSNPIFQRTGGISFTPAATSNELLGTIALPTLDPGWYRATLVIRSGLAEISQHSLRFVQLGDAPGRSMPDERFGVVATSLPPQAWSILPAAMDQLAAGRLKLSVWTDQYAIDSDKAVDFDNLVSKLRGRGIGFTACLAAIPPEIAQRIGGNRWADLLQIPAERWQPQLAYLVSSHANHLTQWQLLDDESAERMVQDKPLRDVYDKLLGEFSKLIDEPDLAMPWPAWVELDAQLPSTVALSVPGEILPEQLPLYIADLRKHRGKTISLVLHPIDREKYGRAAQERDLALRIAYSFVGGADRIDLPLLLEAKTQRGNTTAEPDPLFMIQRTVTTQLSNARCLGKVPIADGVDAILFDKGGQGVMIVWAQGQVNDPTLRTIPIALGRNPTRIDLAGQASPIKKLNADKRNSDDYELVVGTRPIIVTDIDPSLLMLRASVAIDNPLLESSVRSQGRTLVIRNTFDSPISGTVRLTGPAGWKLPIRNSSFSLSPGETYEEPVTIEFPLNATSGPKTLMAELSVEGRRDYRVSVPVPVTIGLSDVGLQTVALTMNGQIFVQQLITNYGTQKIDYNAFVSMPGQPRQERMVTNLGPGMTIIKKYRFAIPSLSTTKLRSGIRELEGRRMLNEEVPIR
jgi:hypothetical protein